MGKFWLGWLCCFVGGICGMAWSHVKKADTDTCTITETFIDSNKEQMIVLHDGKTGKNYIVRVSGFVVEK